MYQPKTIYWSPHEKIKYPAFKKSGSTWEINTQEALELEPGEIKSIDLNFGYMLTEGVILIAPADGIKQSLEFKNPLVCKTKTENIRTLLFNFSKNTVLIPENIPLCFVKYLKP